MPDSASIYDCIIIGGGPAGLTCAIFLGRYRRRVLLCDSSQPRNYASRAIHGFIGQHNIDPAELRRRGREEAIDAGVEVCDCTVSKIESAGDEFCVTTTAGTMRTRRVVLAYGVRDLVPDVPHLTDFYPGSVYHCPDCDGYEVTGKRVGVIGHGKRVAIDALFFSIGTVRSCTLAEDLGCRVYVDEPCIVVDEYKQTTIEGVYAIGDLAPGAQLAVTSAADGAVAAIAINKTLLPPSRRV